MSVKTYTQAVNEAIREEMRRDAGVVIFGEDVAKHGGIFQATKGLLEEFGGDRVKDAPIAEQAIVGTAIGAAATGLRPIAEVMYGDFLLVAFHEVYHMAAKWRFMHGDEFRIPMVIRAAQGSSFGAACEHSNCVEPLFTHSPGLTIISPTNAYDVKGLLKSAIRSNNPVLFLEHKQFYKTKMEVPDEEYTLPIGVAQTRREGRDCTVVAIGLMVGRALEAADILAKEGVEVEVIDPRTIAPMDYDAIYKSVAKTHRLVVAEESNLTNGLGAEISARVMENAFFELDAPVGRVASLDVPVPYNVELEKQVVPSVEKIAEAVRSAVGVRV
ncbi:MAG TPA: alpha-ketoacid dehydrogenase subunit beta [Candidatus Limnocylindria bacterium]|nr:alpha-ketoacid dehydrogenase subunit beta [Candidatus Limnocylindria bacterium]